MSGIYKTYFNVSPMSFKKFCSREFTEAVELYATLQKQLCDSRDSCYNKP